MWNWIDTKATLSTLSPNADKEVSKLIEGQGSIWKKSETGIWEVKVSHRDFKQLIALMYDTTVPTDPAARSMVVRNGSLVYTSNHALCCGLKPDFVVQAKGHSENSTLGCIVMIEITRHSPRLVSFNPITLLC